MRSAAKPLVAIRVPLIGPDYAPFHKQCWCLGIFPVPLKTQDLAVLEAVLFLTRLSACGALMNAGSFLRLVRA